jgi:site-specific DNA recombinase
MTKRAAIYSRISFDPEGKELGVQRQEADCKKLAKHLGINDVVVFRENDRSASTRSKKPRPRYDEMVIAAEAGGFDMILAYSNSRLTRRPLEAERLIQLYEKHGVVIKTVVSGEDDLSTADGRMTARIRASIDAAEAERTSERVERAAEQRALLGEGNGGTRPYGWSADDRTKLNPAEHKVIKLMARKVLAGASLHQVAAYLNERNIPTVKGAAWSPTAVRGILTNPRLVGIRIYKGTPVGVGDWKPALHQDVYDRLRDTLLDKSRRIAMSNQVRNLLTGIALCGECGQKMTAKSQMRKGRPKVDRYLCAACNLYRVKEPIDEYVTGAVIEYLRTAGSEPEVHADPKVLKKVEATRERIRQTQAAYAAADDMTPDDLLAALRPLKDRLQQEEAGIRRRERSPAVVAASGDDAEAKWERLDLGTKRLIIMEVLEIRILRRVRGKHGFDPDSVQLRQMD